MKDFTIISCHENVIQVSVSELYQKAKNTPDAERFHKIQMQIEPMILTDGIVEEIFL
jgi:hypothetical protein